MKILIVSRYILYPATQGSAQHVRTFSNALVSSGHSVEVVSGEDCETYEEILQDNYKVHCIPMDRNRGKLEDLLSPAAASASVYKAARNIISAYSPDVIHVGAFSQLAPFVDVAHQLSIPIVAMVNSYESLCLSKFLIDSNGDACSGPESVSKCSACVFNQLSQKRRLAVNCWEILENMRIDGLLPTKLGKGLGLHKRVKHSLEYLKEFRSKIDFFICQNPDTVKILQEYGVSEQKLKLVPQWLTDEKLKKYGRRKKPNSILKLGYVGKVASWKGAAVLGRALRSLRDHSSIELFVISYGVDHDTVEKEFGRLPQSLEVTLVSGVSEDADVANAISALDICIIPSTCRETGPRTMIEALAQGVPCIVSNSVGNRYLVQDGVNGRIFRSGNSKELSQIIQTIVMSPKIIDTWSTNLPKVNNKSKWLRQVMDIHSAAIKSG